MVKMILFLLKITLENPLLLAIDVIYQWFYSDFLERVMRYCSFALMDNPSLI
ncbi:Uncharacterised protein [Serratia rubidaea]|nr:Uncharacterised protein [Serratia rubidaea]